MASWMAGKMTDERIPTEVLDEVWVGSRAQRDRLRAKLGGRCAYCGCVLDKMHADHLEPVIRVQTDPWGRRLPVSEQRQIRPERNVFSNMMPSCGPCNIHKGGYSLEEWREMLGRASEIIGRKQSIFKTAVRLGLIKVNDGPVTFYFEILRDAREVK